MKLVIAIALLAIASVQCNKSARKLLRSNLNSEIQREEVCRQAELDKLYKTTSDQIEAQINPLKNSIEKEIRRKINHCCYKINTYEKKECLKDAKEQAKDLKRQTRLEGSDSDLIEKADIYNMENKDYVLEEIIEKEQDNKYNNRLSDILENDQYENVLVKLAEDKNDRENENEYERRSSSSLLNVLLKKCTHCNQCRRKMERATSVAARKACVENSLKNGRDSSSTCCKAGELVGATVGKVHKQVCQPSLYKFQTKVQGCGLNHKQQCRKAFQVCCKQASKEVKQDRLIKGDIFESDNIENVEDVEEIIERVNLVGLKKYY